MITDAVPILRTSFYTSQLVAEGIDINWSSLFGDAINLNQFEPVIWCCKQDFTTPMFTFLNQSDCLVLQQTSIALSDLSQV